MESKELQEARELLDGLDKTESPLKSWYIGIHMAKRLVAAAKLVAKEDQRKKNEECIAVRDNLIQANLKYIAVLEESLEIQ